MCDIIKTKVSVFGGTPKFFFVLFYAKYQNGYCLIYTLTHYALPKKKPLSGIPTVALK